ncbi:hypothetical protein DL96DRAFT_1581654 [Flagelloscypha sp. PMI_526]|nr:hypothetical protein DL96DRAFT_1581654 [Flagelloscypha sp. PMI_526]
MVLSLLDLPPELLAHEILIPFLGNDKPSLIACAANSRLLRSICLPYIYKEVSLASPRFDSENEYAGIGDLELLESPDYATSWKTSSQATKFLALLKLSPDIASHVRSLKIVHGASGLDYATPFWVLNDPRMAADIIRRLSHLETLELSRFTEQGDEWRDMSWHLLPSEFTDALWFTVNNLPTFRHLGLGIRFWFESPQAFVDALAILPSSSIQSLSLACTSFENTQTMLIDRSEDFRPSLRPKLRRLDLSYIEENVNGPILTQTLLHPSFPIDTSNLSHLALAGLNWVDHWIGPFLDGQATPTILENVHLGSLFNLSYMPFMTHFSRFSSIHTLSVATDWFLRPASDQNANPPYNPWAHWFDNYLPSSMFETVTTLTLHTDSASLNLIHQDTFPHLRGLEVVLQKRFTKLKTFILHVHCRWSDKDVEGVNLADVEDLVHLWLEPRFSTPISPESRAVKFRVRCELMDKFMMNLTPLA